MELKTTFSRRPSRARREPGPVADVVEEYFPGSVMDSPTIALAAK